MNDRIGDADIAALLDGRLSGEERDRVLRALAASDDDARVLATAAAALRALDDEDAAADSHAPPSASSEADAEVGDDEPGPTAELRASSSAEDAEPTAASSAAPFAGASLASRDAAELRVASPDPPTDDSPSAPVAGEADSGVVPLAPARARRGGAGARGWLLLAASIAAVAIPLGVMRSSGGGPVDAASLAAALSAPAGPLPPGWMDAHPWRSTRGEGTALVPSARSVRVGAYLVDLQVAAAAGDTASVARAAGAVAALVGDLSGSGPAATTYRAIADDPARAVRDGGGALEDARGALQGIVEEEGMRRGAWLRAAGLALARGDAAFLRSRPARAAAGADAEDADAPAAVRTFAAAVAAVAAAGDAPDLPRLQRLADEALEAAGS